MKLTLTDKIQETSDVSSFIFDGPKSLTWQAGQFLRYKLDHQNPDNRGTVRYFSISSAPYEGHPRLTTRFAGEAGSSFKNALKQLPFGTAVETSGPGGDFILPNPDPNLHYVFIAGGIGITPFRAILLDLAHQSLPMNITLLYANRSPEGIPFKEVLDLLAQNHPPFNIYYLINPEHIDEQTIKDKVSNFNEANFYVSGPEPMVESLGEMLKRLGVPENQIKQDFFPGYDHP